MEQEKDITLPIPIELSKVLKVAAKMIGVPLSKVKVGRIIGNAKLNAKIDLIIEIYAKYVLDFGDKKITRFDISKEYNGYHTKINTLKKKWELKGMDATTQYYFNELCKQIESDEKK